MPQSLPITAGIGLSQIAVIGLSTLGGMPHFWALARPRRHNIRKEPNVSEPTQISGAPT